MDNPTGIVRNSAAGGAAGRAGYRYEDWILLACLGEVISGRLASVRFEAPMDPDGLECVCVNDVGLETGIQAKDIASYGNWSMKRLFDDGVLQAFGIWIADDTSRRCEFYASARAEVAPLSDLAQRHSQSLTDFKADVAARALTESLSSLRKYLTAVDPRYNNDTLLHTFLQQTSWKTYDKTAAYDRSIDKLLLSVDPEFVGRIHNQLIVHLSQGLLQQNVDLSVLESFLDPLGDWRRPKLEPLLENINEVSARFIARTQTRRGGRPLIRRAEWSAIITQVREQKGHTVVRGVGGAGKSQLAAVVAEELMSLGWNVLAVNVRELPSAVTNSVTLGAHFNLPHCPVSLLANSGSGQSLLIIDQVEDPLTVDQQCAIEALIHRAREASVRVFVGTRGRAVPESVGEALELLNPVEFIVEEMTEAEYSELLIGLPSPPPSLARLPLIAVMWAALVAHDPALALQVRTQHELFEQYRSHLTREVDGLCVRDMERMILRTPDLVSPNMRGFELQADLLVGSGYFERSDAGFSFSQDIVRDWRWAELKESQGISVASILSVPPSMGTADEIVRMLAYEAMKENRA